jgi:hypothetical protein
MAVNYLFDTNIIIYYLGGLALSETAFDKLDNICQSGSNLSVITKLELLGYNFTSASNEKLPLKNLLPGQLFTRLTWK